MKRSPFKKIILGGRFRFTEMQRIENNRELQHLVIR
jgi:hypothetical protein